MSCHGATLIEPTASEPILLGRSQPDEIITGPTFLAKRVFQCRRLENVVVVVHLEHSHCFNGNLDSHSTASGPTSCRCRRPPGNAVNGHSSTMYFVVRWLSYKIAELTFKALHVDLSPTYLQQCVQVYTPARSLRSVNSYTLVQNRSRTVAGDCTFVHAAATVWNALPVSVTSKDSLLSFKAALKTHLCASAYT